jgi:hypothetical protein
MKGIVYKITSNDKTYIGSTQRTMKERLNSFHHRAFTKYGFDKYNHTIEILEEIEYNDKLELLKLEGEYIQKYDCINKDLPCGLGKDKKQYDKIRYEKNKQKLLQQRKEYIQKNKKRISDYNKQRRQYVWSWGGDPRSNNNLLEINI